MTPSNWFTVYKFEEENNIYVDELSTDILRKCAQIEKSELKVVEKYFEKDLSAALTFVSNDMDDRFKDTVDYKNKEINNKKRRLCEEGHINENIRANRKNCDHHSCTALLKEASVEEIIVKTNDFEVKH